MAKWDSKNLEIRSKSVEQTLVPLVTQITTLVNHKEKGKRTLRALDAIRVVGQTVENAVQKFVDVGEQIASENSDIASEMLESCEEAKKAGRTISSLTSVNTVKDSEPNSSEKSELVRAARSLLSAVTKVLILADSVMIKRLVLAAKKVDERLKELEKVHSFTEFVQAFSQFGADMVNLAHLSGDRQNDLKDDSLRAEMCAARAVLEKSTMMLLTTSKTCLRHPDSHSAKGNRDGVFHKIREAMKTVVEVVNEGKKERAMDGCLAMDLKHFENTVDSFSRSAPDDNDAKIAFQKAFEKIVLDTKTVIDSPHTRKDKRETIVALLENAQDIVNDILEKHKDNKAAESGADTLDLAIQRIRKTSKDLKHEVHQVATDQVFETFSHLGYKKSLPALRTAAGQGKMTQVEDLAKVFEQDAKRLQEVSRVARNMSVTEPIAIAAKKVEENINMLCPQVIDAARTLSGHPVSKIAQENMEVFVDVWEAQVDELGKVLRSLTAGGDISRTLLRCGCLLEVGACTRSYDDEANLPEERVKEYTNIVERMMKRKVSRSRSSSFNSDTETEPEKAVADSREQEKIFKLISDVNLMTSGNELHPLVATDGQIVQRAREMSDMVNEMYLFTKGEGKFQSTEELFAGAQEFGEAGRILHRVARQFATRAEDSSIRCELLGYIDKLPIYCQQLHFTSKSLAAGQSACCRKVGAVMHLTKSIIKIVARTVNSCYLLAEKTSPLKPPPDQRLWQLDNMLSDDSSVPGSCCSSVQSLPGTDDCGRKLLGMRNQKQILKTEL